MSIMRLEYSLGTVLRTGDRWLESVRVEISCTFIMDPPQTNLNSVTDITSLPVRVCPRSSCFRSPHIQHPVHFDPWHSQLCRAKKAVREASRVTAALESFENSTFIPEKRVLHRLHRYIMYTVSCIATRIARRLGSQKAGNY